MDFSEIMPIKFDALSPIEENLEDLFDLRSEMILQTPEKKM